MFEVGECAEMKHNQDGHDFTVGQRCFTMPMAVPDRRDEFAFDNFRIKILTKFIQCTENIRNFVLGNHKPLFL